MNMTFDQLQRYRLAGEIIELLRPRRPLRILDAGSREGFLREFLPEDFIVNLDLAYFPAACLTVGDATELPFRAQAFDAVVALDVLEHIGSSRRTAFLDELARASADLLIVGSPFREEAVLEAETLVGEFNRKLTGKVNEFLDEHLAEGLPGLEEVRAWAERKGFRTVVLPNGYLYRWVPMMCLNGYLSRLSEPWDVIFAANRLYHRRFYSQDNVLPAYRRVLVMSRSREVEAALRLLPARAAAAVDDRADFARVGEEILREIDSEKDRTIARLKAEKEAEVVKLTGMIERLQAEKDAEVVKLTGMIDRKSEQIAEAVAWARRLDASALQLAATARRLDEELQGIKSSVAYRIYARTLGRLRPRKD